MRLVIEAFIWLPDVIEKLTTKHRITPEEVEEIFFDRPRFYWHEKGRIQGEDMYTALGQTEAGRYLIVFFIFKPPRRALIVTAREMTPAERKRYEREK